MTVNLNSGVMRKIKAGLRYGDSPYGVVILSCGHRTIRRFDMAFPWSEQGLWMCLKCKPEVVDPDKAQPFWGKGIPEMMAEEQRKCNRRAREKCDLVVGEFTVRPTTLNIEHVVCPFCQGSIYRGDHYTMCETCKTAWPAKTEEAVEVTQVVCPQCESSAVITSPDSPQAWRCGSCKWEWFKTPGW